SSASTCEAAGQWAAGKKMVSASGCSPRLRLGGLRITRCFSSILRTPPPPCIFEIGGKREACPPHGRQATGPVPPFGSIDIERRPCLPLGCAWSMAELLRRPPGPSANGQGDHCREARLPYHRNCDAGGCPCSIP